MTQPNLPHALRVLLISMAMMAPTSVIAQKEAAAPHVATIINADFETGTVKGWKDWRFRRAEISNNAHAGKHAIALGPESARCCQEVKIRPSSRYRLSAWVKTESGAEQVELIAQDFGGPPVSAASALPDWTKITVEFTSAYACETLLIMLKHPWVPGEDTSIHWNSSISVKLRNLPCRNSWISSRPHRNPRAG